MWNGLNASSQSPTMERASLITERDIARGRGNRHHSDATLTTGYAIETYVDSI